MFIYLVFFLQTYYVNCNINNVSVSTVKLIYNGFDHTSFFASNIEYNNQFIVVSANGYDIFNGIIAIYNKNNIKIEQIIYSPNNLNSNFGSSISINNNNFIAIGAIDYNMSQGVVYIYYLYYNCWKLLQKIKPPNHDTKLLAFGKKITMSNEYIVISTHTPSIYVYKFDLDKNIFVYYKTIKYNTNYFNINIKIYEYNNNSLLFVSNPNRNYYNQIKIYNLTSEHFLYPIGLIKQNSSYFGIDFIFTGNKLYVSSTSPYPFYDYDKFIYYDYIYTEKQIIIYNINIENFNINYQVDTIIKDNFSEFNNFIYFGSNIEIDNMSLFVTGTNYVYQYFKNVTNNEWKLIHKFFVPKSLLNFNYKIKIINKLLFIGSSTYHNMAGGLFIDKIYNDTSRIINSTNLYPENDKTHINYVDENRLSLGIILSFILLFLIITFSISLCIYCRYFLQSSILYNLKKKKKNEQQSPYKIHSYLGYIETDEDIIEDIIEDINIDKKNKYITSPYKIHSYSGYVENLEY